MTESLTDIENNEEIAYVILSFDDSNEDFYDNFWDSMNDHWEEHTTIIDDIDDDIMIYSVTQVLNEKYKKSRFVIKFGGSTECFNNFLSDLKQNNVVPLIIVNLNKNLTDSISYTLFRALNTLRIHIDDYNEYEEYRKTFKTVVDEDIENYGEIILTTFPELLI